MGVDDAFQRTQGRRAYGPNFRATITRIIHGRCRALGQAEPFLVHDVIFRVVNFNRFERSGPDVQ